MEKNNLHPRNKHRSRYDFANLVAATPELKKYIIKNKYNGEDTIDFSHQEAVKLLNRAILKSFYQIDFWDIPPHYLCPPIPGRADYLHYAADLLQAPFYNEKIRVLDIGVGANCVYPLIGQHEYGWHFVGAEIDQQAFVAAQKNVQQNKLTDKIEIRKQSEPRHIFRGIINLEDKFDLVICNPPFHGSQKEAQEGSQRKNKNLGTKNKLNFGGQSQELWCEGGESDFIRRMIEESRDFKNQCTWFSTLVSSKENLSGVYGELKRNKAVKVETVEMAQGQKISRFVAWTFKGEL